MSPPYRYAYLHGFASGAPSTKGVALAERFAPQGITLLRPDLNCPSFARLSHEAMLQRLDELDGEAREEGARWRFVASSLGGWLAARWAELNLERVERLVLLCPGFALASRWPALVGDAGMRRWEREGSLALPDGAGREVPVHWGFIEEARRQPAWPEVPCPTLVIHGRRDETVPVDSSRRYAAERAHVTLIELDDDHGLARSIDRIAEEALRFFET